MATQAELQKLQDKIKEHKKEMANLEAEIISFKKLVTRRENELAATQRDLELQKTQVRKLESQLHGVKVSKGKIKSFLTDLVERLKVDNGKLAEQLAGMIKNQLDNLEV